MTLPSNRSGRKAKRQKSTSKSDRDSEDFEDLLARLDAEPEDIEIQEEDTGFIEDLDEDDLRVRSRLQSSE